MAGQLLGEFDCAVPRRDDDVAATGWESPTRIATMVDVGVQRMVVQAAASGSPSSKLLLLLWLGDPVTPAALRDSDSDTCFSSLWISQHGNTNNESHPARPRRTRSCPPVERFHSSPREGAIPKKDRPTDRASIGGGGRLLLLSSSSGGGLRIRLRVRRRGRRHVQLDDHDGDVVAAVVRIALIPPLR